ncbi:MAG: histidine kinase [Acidobacteria bacterium]|nr:histidine kinase [Acidobacteriota bacterium]
MKRWLQLLALNAVISCIPPLLLMLFGGWGRWRALMITFAYSYVFSNVIGLISAGIMPMIAPRLFCLPTLRRWSSIAALLALVAVGGTALATALLVLIGVVPFNEITVTFRNSVKIAVILTEAFGIGSVVYASLRTRLEATTLELRTRELEKERAEKLASDARLASLESRIHPHFLFNALNSVSALIREDPDRAEQQVERISRFLRFAIDQGGNGLVTVEQEMKTVTDYLEIERTRFGDRLRYDIQVDAAVLAQAVPPMAVQTLVENSVKYAVSPRREGGLIRVRATREGGHGFELTVWDDGPGFNPEIRPSGHGLDLLEGRLAVQYGSRAAMRFANGTGMTVTLEIPFAEIPCARIS